jgi:putative MATE family efflux protein
MDQTKDEMSSESGFWRSVLEAVRGKHDHDYTSGPLGRSILLLAVPMVLEMVLESVFAVVDVFFVSRLGPDATATVGLTESMLTIIYTLAIGLSIGAGAMVARRTGEKDPEGASKAAGQTIVLGAAIAVVVGLAGALFAPQLLAWMGASTALIETGSGYTRLMLGGNLVIFLLFLVNAVFRGAGDGAIAMRALWLSNGINIALCPCLILGVGPFPKLGLLGAAVATTIGRGTGATYTLTRLLRGGVRIRVLPRHFRIDPVSIRTLIRLSASGTFQTFIGMASWIAMVRAVSGFGSAALAGYTIAMRMVMFALLPAFGLANAAATLVGQALGANKPERAEQAVWASARYNAWVLGAVSVLFVVFAHGILGLFTPDPEVIAFGVDGLRIVSAGFLFYAYGMVLTQSFNGAGDTWTPTVINLGVFWALEIPLAYALALPLGMGPRGVYIAILIAFSLVAIVSALLFRRGRWKTQKV